MESDNELSDIISTSTKVKLLIKVDSKNNDCVDIYFPFERCRIISDN